MAELPRNVVSLEERADGDLARVKKKGRPEPETGPAFRIVPMGGLDAARDELPRFVVRPLIPRGVVSLLGAHGGTGKTLLAATWAAHVACGQSWGPYQFEQGRVLFVSLEDPGARIKSMLSRVAAHYGLPLSEIEDRVSILDGSATDATLAAESADFTGKRLIETAALAELRELATGFDLIIIDNASDAFSGNENERRQVRQFMRGMLGGIARQTGAGLLLLAHVDKAAAKFGAQRNSYSGSTAWHNSARSRVAIVESDGAIDLVHEKLNLGRRAEPIRLQWSEHGVLQPVAMPDQGEGGGLILAHDAARVLDAIRAAINEGASITTARQGSCTTWHALAAYQVLPPDLCSAKGKSRFLTALNKLARDGRIVAETFTTPNRKVRERWAIAP